LQLFQGARIRAACTAAAAISMALLAAAPASAADGTPTTPTELFNQYQACSTDVNAPVYVAGRDGLIIEGISSDTDSSVTTLTEQFQSWPLSDPTQIVTNSNAQATAGNEATVNLTGPLADGQSYAWQARTVDANGDASAWSAPCYVTDDDTAPAAVPTVTSANYPLGQTDQGGSPIQLTLGANGVSDVGGFAYSWSDSFPVAGGAVLGDHGIPVFQDPYSEPQFFAKADTVGGSATVDLIPPSDTGYLTLYVMSLDRAFNLSRVTTYSVWLKPDAPTVTQLSHPSTFGKPTAFEFTPNPQIQAASPVVSYTVVDLGSQGQTSTTVRADGAGTARLKLALDSPTGDLLHVSSTSADGWVSQYVSWSNGNLDTTPTVTSDVYTENGSSGGVGVPGTFTFAPKVNGVAGYTYTFNGSSPATVKARGQGRDAQISWTPSQSGWYELTVYATTRSGIQLSPYYYSFSVN
jgi:hypothetical protein